MKAIICLGKTGRWCLLGWDKDASPGDVVTLKQHESMNRTIDHMAPGVYQVEFLPSKRTDDPRAPSAFHHSMEPVIDLCAEELHEFYAFDYIAFPEDDDAQRTIAPR
ncbi:MAG: hypothetical protein FVQ81_01980 [Candidatus Glassbacteria bacterium]|nr:hypothetical protein [Candidatus Glassbacteria bacterium]